MCRELQADVLVSKALANQLPSLNWFESTSVGTVELKGKAEKLELARVELRNPDKVGHSEQAVVDVEGQAPACP